MLALLLASAFDTLWQLLFAFFAAVSLFSDEDRNLHRIFGRVLLLACLFNALVSLFQYGGQAELGGFLFFHAPPGAIVGNLRQTNNLSTLMAVGIALLAGSPEAQAENSRWRHSLTVMALLFACVAALTASRSGLLTSLAVCGAGLFLLRRKNVVLAAFAGTLLTNIWLALDGGSERSSALLRFTSEGVACAGRRAIWSDGLEMIRANPWTGWGWESLRYVQVVLGSEGQMQSCNVLGELHNEALQIAATLGIPALLLVTALLIYWAIQGYRRYSPEKAVYLLVLLPLLLHSMLEYPLRRPLFLMILAFAVVGLLAGGEVRKSREFRHGRMLSIRFWVLVLVIVTAAESSSLSVSTRNLGEGLDRITATERFFHPRESLFLTFFSATSNEATARLLLKYEESLMKSAINMNILEKLWQAAETVGDTGKMSRYERMIDFESNRLVHLGGARLSTPIDSGK